MENKQKSRIVFVLVSLLLILSVASSVLAHVGEDDYGHHGMMGGYFGGMWGMSLFGWVFMILIIVALILFIIWMIKQIQEPKRKR